MDIIGDFILNIVNWYKYRYKLVMDKYIIQTSSKKDLTTPDIKIKNYIMSKKINGFLDFRDSYFSKHKSDKNIIIELCYDNFGDYLIEDSFYSIKNNYDVVINDYSKDILIKEVIKDLVILEFDKKQVLIYFGNISSIDSGELGKYIIDETSKFIIFNFELLMVYPIEDLQVYFGLQYRKTNPRRILDRMIHLFKVEQKLSISQEEESFCKLFSKNNIDSLSFYDFEKYIYFNNDFKVAHKDIVNVASVGVTGGGKTHTLNLMLLQILFSNDFKRIIYFDTQNSFERNVMYNVSPIYANRVSQLQENYFKVDETNFYLNEVDFVNAINFLMESKGYTSSSDKASLLKGIEYEEAETFREIVKEILHEQRTTLSVSKELEKLEDIDMILSFLNKINIKKTSLFDDLESNNKFFLILSFKDSFFYEVSTYLYLQRLKDLLYDAEDKRTFLFADETQKYLSSRFLKKILLDLVKEKRQYGFRFFYTGLSYDDVKEFVKFTQHIVFNSFNDVYLMNTIKSLTSQPIDSLKTPIEKVLYSANDNKVNKTSLTLPFLRTNKKSISHDEKKKPQDDSPQNALFSSNNINADSTQEEEKQ